MMDRMMRLQTGKATGGRSDPGGQPDLTLLHGILQSTTQNTLFLRGAQAVLQETPGPQNRLQRGMKSDHVCCPVMLE